MSYISAEKKEEEKRNIVLIFKKLFLIKGQSLISIEKPTLELISNIIKMEEFQLKMKISN